MKIKTQIAMGLGVLAACTVVSCSNEYEGDYNVDHETVVEQYEQGFINNFGTPATNHTWGFGTASVAKARTRGVNPNGNEWGNYVTNKPADVTTEEKNLVYAYVSKQTGENSENIDLAYYFVTQVWKGDADTYTGTDGSVANKTPETTSYTYDDNGPTTQTVAGGSGMNQLAVLENGDKTTATIEDYQHVYDFNDANNTDWNGHMLMYESGTKDFMSHNSISDHYSTKYIIVAGAAIDESLKDYYYVCFDFENEYTDEEKANETTKALLNGSYEKKVIQGGDKNISFTIELDANSLDSALKDLVAWLNNNKYLWVNNDYNLDANNIENLAYTTSSGSWGTNLSVTGTLKTGAEATESWETVPLNGVNLQAKGFYTEAELKENNGAKAVQLNGETAEIRNVNVTVKLLGYTNGKKHFAGDDNHTDWIVRITPGIPVTSDTPSDEPTSITLRVMCEDLGGTISDYDFNDVVFDATWPGGADGTDEGSVRIQICAAGGTLPVTVGGRNIHSAFGSDVKDSEPVNVGSPLGKDGRTAEPFDYPIAVGLTGRAAIEAVPIVVTKDGETYTINRKDESDKNVPQKFATDPSVRWTKEGIRIDSAYPSFKNWVGNENVVWYENPNANCLK